jgi:hypothetical protein
MGRLSDVIGTAMSIEVTVSIQDPTRHSVAFILCSGSIRGPRSGPLILTYL